MHRLFVALRPPAAIRDRLTDLMDGVPAARWQDDEQLHLTLRYVGEVDRRMAEDVAAALGRVSAPPIDVRLAGVGAFDKAGRVNALWAGVAPDEPLAALHRKVDRALASVGLPPEGRAYRPHVTLARLARAGGAGAEIALWQARHAGLSSDPFRLDHLILYESRLGAGGAQYDAIARWPLRSVGRSQAFGFPVWSARRAAS